MRPLCFSFLPVGPENGGDASSACPEPHLTLTRDGRYRAQCFSQDYALVTDLQTGQLVLDAEAWRVQAWVRSYDLQQEERAIRTQEEQGARLRRRVKRRGP